MTTIDLLQRYPPHKDSIHHGRAPDSTKPSNSEKPDRTMPDLGLSQHSDEKSELLHNLLDKVVKDIADSKPEPVSEYEGTFWRSPLRPRSRSPAYSEISDSFESPSRIEHCIDNLLSTPMTPWSAQCKGPDGWPLGVEVAMNDFHRGRLSTPILQEKELPNPLVVRKKKQQNPPFANNGVREAQETTSCESVPSEQHGDNQRHEESVILKPLALQKQQRVVLSQQHGETQDHPDSASPKPLASQQQSHTHHQNCQHQQESVDINLLESHQQRDEEIDIDLDCIPTLSARKYGDNQDSLVNASSELHPTLAHGKLPIGPGFESAGCDKSYIQIDGTGLLNKDGPQTGLSDSLPDNEETHDEHAHQAEPRNNALADALDENTNPSKALDPCEYAEVESIDRKIGCQNTFEDKENDTFQGITPLEDSSTGGGSKIISWKRSGPLEGILEESEDTPATTLTLDRGQPQHSTFGTDQPLDCQNFSRMGAKYDGMQTESFTSSSNPPRVPPSSKLTFNPSSRAQSESTSLSRYSSPGAMSSGLTLSAATMAELKDPARKKGKLSAAALAEMRKTAESQPHFRTGPSLKDQSQANIHPLLRSKSHSRLFSQPTPLKYVFKDDDSEGHESDEGDNSSPQITLKPRSQLEASDTESVVTQIAMKEHPSSQLGMMGDTGSKHPLNDNGMENHEAECAEALTPRGSALRSSNELGLDSIPGDKSPDAMPSSVFQPSTSPSTTGYYPNVGIGSPATYNSWASTPHSHEHGHCSSTPRGSALRSSNELGLDSIPGDKSPDAMPSSIFQPSTSPSTTGYYPNVGIISPATHNSWASTPHSHEHGHCSSTPSSALTHPASTVPTPNTAFNSNSSTACGTTMTPSSSFSDFTGNKTHRRSNSFSSVLTRFHKGRYSDLPTAPMTDSTVSLKKSAEMDQARDDPFTSTNDTRPPSSFNLKAPSKETQTDAPTVGVDKLSTPTKPSANRFGFHVRSLSSSGRPKPNEGIGRPRSRLHKRNSSTAASVNAAAQPDGSGLGDRRNSILVTTTVEQKWEKAPPPTPIGLCDEFSMRYTDEPVGAEDHYASNKDAPLQGMKEGLKKVFGRK